jgi:hypothetical protein
LNGTPKQFERLRALQVAFADVCNAIAPVVQSTRCWNRVALHHLVYRSMRERFPALGSQLICNAVYSVARNARLVLQHPQSPWNVSKHSASKRLPLLRFSSSAPVYFDRHTLSLRGGALSMFTLDGRIRFDLSLAPADEARFHQEKLVEVMLAATASGFGLTFQFAGPDRADRLQEMSAKGLLPEYVLIIPPDAIPSPPDPAEISPPPDGIGAPPADSRIPLQ